jgi:hypothetical protein
LFALASHEFSFGGLYGCQVCACLPKLGSQLLGHCALVQQRSADVAPQSLDPTCNLGSAFCNLHV